MDSDILVAVCQELAADRQLDAADIHVEVVNGEVSLLDAHGAHGHGPTMPTVHPPTPG